MSEPDWPSCSEVHAAVRDRLELLLEEQGGLVAHYARRTMSQGSGVLSQRPHSTRTVLVPGACVCAGGNWRAALWPAAAAECLMAAADLFDDVADADPGSESESAGVVLTAAAGLLSLAGSAVVRVVDDGGSATTAVALALCRWCLPARREHPTGSLVRPSRPGSCRSGPESRQAAAWRLPWHWPKQNGSEPHKPLMRSSSSAARSRVCAI